MSRMHSVVYASTSVSFNPSQSAWLFHYHSLAYFTIINQGIIHYDILVILLVIYLAN